MSLVPLALQRRGSLSRARYFMMAIKPTDLSRDVMHLLKDHGPVVLTYFAIVATFWGCQFNRLRYLVARLVTLLAVVRRHRFRK